MFCPWKEVSKWPGCWSRWTSCHLNSPNSGPSAFHFIFSCEQLYLWNDCGPWLFTWQCGIKIVEARAHFCGLSQEVLKSLNYFCPSDRGNHIYQRLFTSKKAWICVREVSDRKWCPFEHEDTSLTWKSYWDSSSLFPHTCRPWLQIPYNYPHHRSLESSPSTTGDIRRAKCLPPHREKCSFVWRGSLLIQRLCSPVTVPWSEGREIFVFSVTDCCGKAL